MRLLALLSVSWQAALVAAAQLATRGSAGPAKVVIHQYTAGEWLENLAIRANGMILATEASSPRLYAINPATGASTLVHTFPGVTGLVGITETTPDMFYLMAGNFSLATYQGVKGSFSVWQVDYTGAAAGSGLPVITKHQSIPTAKFLDGMTTLNASAGLVLACDINLGNIIRIDLPNKASTVISTDPLLGTSPSGVLAVDGIHYRNSAIYFDNPGKNVTGKLPVDSAGNPTGPATVIQPIGGDDFTFDAHGNIYLVGGSNNLTYIYGQNLSQVRNLTTLPGPTAAKFGRTASDAGCLYVTTSGGDGAYANPPVSVSGAVYGVDVFNNGSCPGT